MRTREYAGCAVQIDDEGFLLDGSQWTPDLAEEIAREAGVCPLTEEHWTVITFCREDAAREGRPPGLRRIAKNTGVDMRSLHRLFPSGAGRLAVRIAGLPKGPAAPGSRRNLGDCVSPTKEPDRRSLSSRPGPELKTRKKRKEGMP